MTNLIVQISKYLMIILFLVYTYECFHVFQKKVATEDKPFCYTIQRMAMYMIHFDAFLVLYLTNEMDKRILGLYGMQLLFIVALQLIYRMAYKNVSELVLNNMCMLMMIGYIVLTRLSIDRVIRQFVFSVVGAIIALFIPVILSRKSMFRKLKWLYAVVGIVLLGIVLVLGATSYGAKLSITIMGITIQPSEFVKIIFVFYIAGMLYIKNDFKQVVITSGICAIFVLILVASRDLGGALLYFFTYLVMIYVATGKKRYFWAGIVGMVFAAIVGYYLFSHVQTRVIAWSDPLSVIDKEGYQVCQSLFAIGTGGWFGLGLNQGMPSKIPVVDKDFIFSAIAEEFGGIFADCIIMVCVSCFFMIMNIAMKLKDQFYKLVAVGLGTIYALQVFLMIGGGIKFIPSTGVTLPLISYGGSSLLSTMIMFGIVQALYFLRDQKK